MPTTAVVRTAGSGAPTAAAGANVVERRRLEIDPGRLFSPFAITARRAVLVAVSGGGDSTALLVLLTEWLRQTGAPTKLLAVTVDHGLRPGSECEASAVAGLCARRGIAHLTVRWEGVKPAAGLPAAARLARYRLLGEAAAELGTDLVFTGHTADDQAETVLMRQQRGSGRGLAGMAPATLFRGQTWIARPLLTTSRQALREELVRRAVAWVDDPTNVDHRFERPRWRADLAASASETVDALRLASDAAAKRAELGVRAARFISAASLPADPGSIRLPAALAMAGDRDAAIYALRILLAVTGDAAQLPDGQRTADLWQRLNGGGRLKAELCRCRIESCGEVIVLRRDSRGHAGPSPRLRLAPWADFLPSFDLAPARAAAELIEAPQPPDPPFAAPSLRHSVG